MNQEFTNKGATWYVAQLIWQLCKYTINTWLTKYHISNMKNEPIYTNLGELLKKSEWKQYYKVNEAFRVDT